MKGHKSVSHDLNGWQALWFPLHVGAVYLIVNFCTPWLAGWTRGTVLPVLHQPTARSSFEFLYSHIFAFSFVPAFAVGLVNARFKHKVADFVWLLPALVLIYKLLTFSAPSIFQSQWSAAFHQYFAGEFTIPEFHNWREFWDIVRTNPDMLRGKAQLDFTAPFYAGVGYSASAWIGRRTDFNRKVANGVEKLEHSRFGTTRP